MTTKHPIQITCPNGHSLRASAKAMGKRLSCPVCGESVNVPSQNRADSFTDTGVMRILGDYVQLPSQPTPKMESTTRSCPGCSAQISIHGSVCKYCNYFIGSVSAHATTLT